MTRLSGNKRGPRKTRLDAVDVDNLDEMLASGSYRIIEGRIRKVVDEAMEELLFDWDAVKTAQIRGKIEGLRLALDIPAILKQEADKGGEPT